MSTTTPLIEFITLRKHEWNKFKEEKKEGRRRRDLERRKLKEENKRIKRENKELNKVYFSLISFVYYRNTIINLSISVYF